MSYFYKVTNVSKHKEGGSCISSIKQGLTTAKHNGSTMYFHRHVELPKHLAQREIIKLTFKMHWWLKP